MAKTVLGYISGHGEITRSQLLRQFSHRITGKELSEIMDTLVKSDRVEATVNGRMLIYRAVTSKK